MDHYQEPKLNTGIRLVTDKDNQDIHKQDNLTVCRNYYHIETEETIT